MTNQPVEPAKSLSPTPLSFFSATMRVFWISGVNPFKGRKGVMLTIFAFLPVLIMILGRIFGMERGGGSLFFTVYLIPFYHYINLLVFIFLGCSALGESIEDKTITYDLVCPLSRPSFFLGKTLAFLGSSMVLLWPALITAYLICMAQYGMDSIVRNGSTLFAVLFMTLVAAWVYGSMFIFFSLMVKRSVLYAIVLAVAMDGFVAYIPLSISSLSPLVHIRNLTHFLSGETNFLKMLDVYEIDLPLGQSLGVIVLIGLVCLVAGIWRFNGKQFT